jgi:hypothetical protein
MPINIPLSSPEPDDQIPGQTSFDKPAEPPKRTRRTKKQMIDDAVIPSDDAIIEVKDLGTGAKIERPWSEAVQLVADEKVAFVDASLKYAVMKMAQQATSEPEQIQGEKRYVPQFHSHMVKNKTFTDAAGVEHVAVTDIFGGHKASLTKFEWDSLPFDKPSEAPAERETRYTIDGKALLKTGSEGSAGGDRLIHYSDANGGLGEMFEQEWELLSMSPPPSTGPVASSNIPPEAEIGDEVLVGAETLRIGHDRTLTSSTVAVKGEVIQPKRRWQRELGAGPNGPWESTVINSDGGIPPKQEKPVEQPAPVEAVPATQNGHGGKSEDVQRTTTEAITSQGGQIDWVDQNVIKIGTGTLDKIGLPNYSSIQVGPVTLSRSIVDDGRRQVVDLPDGRQGEVISAAVEGFELLNNTVEFVAARFRGELQAFLAATGALSQPVA